MHHRSFFSVVCPEIWEMKICVFSCVLIFILFDYFFNSWYKTRLWICFFIITHQVLQGHFLTNYTFSPVLCSPRRPFGVWSLVFLFLFYSTVFCVTVSSPSFFFSKKKNCKANLFAYCWRDIFQSLEFHESEIPTSHETDLSGGACTWVKPRLCSWEAWILLLSS